MGKMEMHIAFEAARMLETEPATGLCDVDCIVDPDVDCQGNPFVMVRVDDRHQAEIQQNLPDRVTVLNRDILIIVMPPSARMN